MRLGNYLLSEAGAAIAEAIKANKATHEKRALACALQRMLYAVVLSGDSPHFFGVDDAAGIDLSTLDAVHEDSGAGPLPRGGTSGFVQYLDPSETSVMRTLSCTALFAREASVAVAEGLKAEDWAWREAR